MFTHMHRMEIWREDIQIIFFPRELPLPYLTYKFGDTKHTYKIHFILNICSFFDNKT